ncbi:MAG: hypothetical protein KY442_10090, partial [Proteobacteria bacterium]|nr:hypothetical protein [Pseudomonadota bacterium]
PGDGLRERAGTLIHEAFHVHQRTNHAGWSANEVELFTYPADDASLLVLRRTETEALRRAIAAPSAQAATCWARTPSSWPPTPRRSRTCSGHCSGART